MIISMNTRHMNTLGKRVRLLRLSYEWTQDQLIDAVKAHGVTMRRSYISKMENGGHVPSGNVVRALAQALNTTTDYLLLLTDEDEPKQTEAIEAISEEAEEVAQIVDEMTPERRQDALAVVRALHQKDNVNTVLLKRYDVLMNRIRERDGDAGVARAEDLLRRFLDSLSVPGSAVA